MTRCVYIASSEWQVSKSAIALGVLELFARQVRSVGFFRPLVQSLEEDGITTALLATNTLRHQSFEDSVGVSYEDWANDPETAIDTIVAKYSALAERFEAIVIVGSDFDDLTYGTELDHNALIAANLNAPVLYVCRASDRSVDEGEELGPQSGVEGAGLALEPVRRAARHGAVGGDGGIGIEEDSEVREQAFGGPQGQIPDIINAEAAGDSLVGNRGVEVAVGQDHVTALEGGADPGGDVVGAVGGVQERLGAGSDVAAVQEELANGAAEVGAAGLASQDAVDAGGGEEVGEDADLGGLTDAVAAFEGDEQARVRGAGRVGRLEGVLRARGAVGHGPSVAGLVGESAPSPRSVQFRLEIGPVPARDRSTSAPDAASGAHVYARRPRYLDIRRNRHEIVRRR